MGWGGVFSLRPSLYLGGNWTEEPITCHAGHCVKQGGGGVLLPFLKAPDCLPGPENWRESTYPPPHFLFSISFFAFEYPFLHPPAIEMPQHVRSWWVFYIYPPPSFHFLLRRLGMHACMQELCEHFSFSFDPTYSKAGDAQGVSRAMTKSSRFLDRHFLCIRSALVAI